MSEGPPPAQPPAALSVRDLESAIRDRINQPERSFKLRQDAKTWNEVASALDVIGDTEVALSSYLSLYPSDPDLGTRYLLVYGVMQALYIQQDAVGYLSEALGGLSKQDVLGDGRIKAVREARNQATGHPTSRNRKPITSHHISRMTMDQDGFTMITADEHGERRIEHVNVVRLISDQREAMVETLKALGEKLDHDDQEVRKSLQHERLMDVFPSTLSYTFEKMGEATQDSQARTVLGPGSLTTIKDVMRKFIEALERRGLGQEAYPGIEVWFAGISHPIAELDRFFDASAESALHPETAAILVGHLRHKFDELQKMATSIDEDWQPKTP